MTMTRRLNEFVKEVARTATSDGNPAITYDECIAEYTDQIVSDDYFCVVAYAYAEGISIPKALRDAIN